MCPVCKDMSAPERKKKKSGKVFSSRLLFSASVRSGHGHKTEALYARRVKAEWRIRGGEGGRGGFKREGEREETKQKERRGKREREIEKEKVEVRRRVRGGRGEKRGKERREGR